MKYKIGACYHPPYFSEGEWEKDIKKMKEIGFNYTRTGELIASWEWMEPREGEINWYWLDRYLDLCQRHGIKVILGTGTAGTPIWVYKKLKEKSGIDIRVLDNYDHPYPLNTGWSWACPDHDEYRQILKDHIETVVNRYREHPAVDSWQVSNELSYPFVKREEKETSGLFCYCSETIQLFREWLKGKYNSLEELSRAWMWTPTNVRFGSWEQIEPPRAKPSGWGNFGAWLDWRQFSMSRIEEFLQWQVGIVKSLTDKKAMTNLFYFNPPSDPFGAINAMSPYRATNHVDILGVDVYPGDRQYSEREYCSLHLNAGRDDADRKNKGFWVPELQSGPIYGFVEGPLGKGTGKETVRYLSDTISHGSQLTLFMGWKDYPSLPLYWGGIVEMDGEDTERTAAVQKRLKEISDWPEDDYNPCEATAGIFIDERNGILLTGLNEQEIYRQAVQGSYRLFYDENIPVRLVREEDFTNNNLDNLDLIVFPLAAAISDQLLTDIKEYVSNGGNIIVTPQFGFIAEGSHRRLNVNKELKDFLGSEGKRITGGVKPSITIGEVNFIGAIHRENIHPCREVEVIGSFDDDSPAIVQSQYGDGQIIRFGTHYDIAYFRNDNYQILRMFNQIIERLNLRKPFKLINLNDEKKGLVKLLDIHLLKGKEYSIINIINNNDRDISANLVLENKTFSESYGDGIVKRHDDNKVIFEITAGGVMDLIYN